MVQTATTMLVEGRVSGHAAAAGVINSTQNETAVPPSAVDAPVVRSAVRDIVRCVFVSAIFR
jgi:hypothetical protein